MTRVPRQRENRNLSQKKSPSRVSFAWTPFILIGIGFGLVGVKDTPQFNRSPASVPLAAIPASDSATGETDPILVRFQSEALAIIETYAETGGPRSFRTEVPQGAERYEARANYALREMGKKLHQFDPKRFQNRGLSIQNVATLLETVPGHGMALAELLRTHRGDLRREVKIEIWQRARAGLPFQLDSETKGRDKKPRNLYISTDPNIEELKQSALKIIDQFADQGGPWPKDMKADPDRYQAASRALSNLRRMNLRLSELDPSRFVADRTLENLARLFDGESEEGTALAVLLRHDRKVRKAEIPRVTRNWFRLQKQRKAIECVLETRAE